MAVRGLSEGDAARAWSANGGQLPAADSDRPADWATESFELAKTTAYRFEGFACKKNRLSFAGTDDYDAAALVVVRNRIPVAVHHDLVDWGVALPQPKHCSMRFLNRLGTVPRGASRQKNQEHSSERLGEAS